MRYIRSSRASQNKASQYSKKNKILHGCKIFGRKITPFLLSGITVQSVKRDIPVRG
jgi:hypothetical protein